MTTGALNQVGMFTDKEMIVRENGLAALTASTTLFDFDLKAAARNDMTLRAYIESISVANDDELYRIRILGSNDADYSDIEVLAHYAMGASGSRPEGARSNGPGEAIDLSFSTVQAGTAYRYLRIRLTISGTSPSIGLNSYIGKR